MSCIFAMVSSRIHQSEIIGGGQGLSFCGKVSESQWEHLQKVGVYYHPHPQWGLCPR